MLEILIALLAGILTIAAPCILPLLPIILGASIGQTNKQRPLFITLGFILSFAVLSLTLSFIIQTLNLSPDFLRNFAVALLFFFGFIMIWPRPFEMLMQYASGFINKANQVGTQAGSGNWGGFVLGVVLGIIWAPCAGPVLGSILTLIALKQDLVRASILLLAYSIGAGIPMLIIAYGGQYVTTKVRAISNYSALLQQIFGVIIILLAIAIFLQYDTLLIAKLTEYFPSLTPKF